MEGNGKAKHGSLLTRANIYQGSAAQQRLIKMRHTHGGVSTQIVGSHLLMRGALDVERLRMALRDLVRRHSILRTNYAFTESDDVVAIVHNLEGPNVFTVDETTGLSDEGDIRRHIDERVLVATSEFAYPNRHSMLQAILVPHIEGLSSLLLLIDHIAIDERSKPILQRELAALYRGDGVSLPEPVGYDPALVRNDFPSISAVPEIADLLSPLPPRILTSPDPQREPDAFRAVTASFDLESSVADNIDSAAKRRRSTRFMIYLAAHIWMLKHFTNSDDVSVGVPMDTRTHPRDFETVGFFQNIVLLRSRTPRSDGLEATFNECRAITLDGLQRRDYPMASLVSYARDRRPNTNYRNPLYQVTFVYATENVDSGWELDGLDVKDLDLESAEAPYELCFLVSDDPSGPKCLLIGAQGALSVEDLNALHGLWRDAVRELSSE